MLAESTLVSGVGHLTPESGKYWRRTWRAVEAVEDELLDPDPSAGRAAAVRRYAELMLLNIVRWLTRTSDPSELDALAALGDQRLMRALAAAADEVERSWTVARMAEIAGMSRSTFARRFQAMTGSTPLHTLTMIRLRRAAELLAHSDLSVDDAAAQAGYASSAAFIRAFNRAYGRSPAHWRRTHGSDPGRPPQG
jgi:transcriptional regulator GlxA family with amidase domain